MPALSVNPWALLVHAVPTPLGLGEDLFQSTQDWFPVPRARECLQVMWYCGLDGLFSPKAGNSEVGLLAGDRIMKVLTSWTDLSVGSQRSDLLEMDHWGTIRRVRGASVRSPLLSGSLLCLLSGCREAAAAATLRQALVP